jgi:hypothetical protein
MASDLLQHPTDVVNNQLEVHMVRMGGERVCPPRKAEDHEKNTIWSTTVKVIKRKIIREWSISRRPCFAGSRLDGKPPFDDLHAELLRVYVLTTFEVPSVLYKHSNFGRPVSGR